MAKKLSSQQKSKDKILWLSFFVDVSDVVINVTIAIITGSVTMLTQALEGAVDLLSSTLLLIGAHYSKKKPDKKHPFGYGREIYFWSLLSMLSMFSVTAVLSIYWGWQRVMQPEDITHTGWALFALGTGLITNGYSSYVSIHHLLSNQKTPSRLAAFRNSADIEVKTAFALDFMGTIASFIGMVAIAIFVVTGDARYDGLGAVAVGIAVGVFAIVLIRDVKNLLVGQSASPQTVKIIRKIVRDHASVNKIVTLRTVFIGNNKLLVAMELNFKDRLSTGKIEKAIDAIEEKIQEQVPNAKEIFIEAEA